MSIVSKVTEAVVQFIPDRDRDQLSEADRLIGKPIDRVDGRDKVTGVAPFTAEFPVENLAYAALVYSSIPKEPSGPSTSQQPSVRPAFSRLLLTRTRRR